MSAQNLIMCICQYEPMWVTDQEHVPQGGRDLDNASKLLAPLQPT